MNRRSILAVYKKKSSHFQTGATGFKSGNLFNLNLRPPGYESVLKGFAAFHTLMLFDIMLYFVALLIMTCRNDCRFLFALAKN